MSLSNLCGPSRHVNAGPKKSGLSIIATADSLEMLRRIAGCGSCRSLYRRVLD